MTECDLGKQLEMIHHWLHQVTRALTKEELNTANALGGRIVDMLNDCSESNGVKLLALFDALVTGAEHLEQHEGPEPESEPEPGEKPTTIQ